MANYHIEAFNSLYQVVDSKTKRIIATFISESDAQTFLQTLYSKMFQEKKDIIANQFLLSKNSDKFFNKAINGDITNEYGDFDNDFEKDYNIEDSEDIGEYDDVIPSETADLSIPEYNLPKDYWNVIKKDKRILNNLDDNSLGEASNYNELSNNLDVKDNIVSSDFPPNIITDDYEKMEDKTSEYVYLDSATNSTISSTNLETIQFNQTKTNELNNNNPYDLKSIYSGFLEDGENKDLSENAVDSFNLTNDKIEKTFDKINSTVASASGDTNVIDLGPIQEEDDIFSTPRNDEMSERDMEKAILAGTLKILSPKEQKKEDKRLKKLKKLENKKK